MHCYGIEQNRLPARGQLPRDRRQSTLAAAGTTVRYRTEPVPSNPGRREWIGSRLRVPGNGGARTAEEMQ